MRHYNYFNFSLKSRGKLGGELKQSEVCWAKRGSSLWFVGCTIVGVPLQHCLGSKVSQNLMEQLHHILLQSPPLETHTHTHTHTRLLSSTRLKYVSGSKVWNRLEKPEPLITYSWVKSVVNDLSLHDESLPWELSTGP